MSKLQLWDVDNGQSNLKISIDEQSKSKFTYVEGNTKIDFEVSDRELHNTLAWLKIADVLMRR